MEESPVGDHQANVICGERGEKHTRTNSDAEGRAGDQTQCEADGRTSSGAVAGDPCSICDKSEQEGRRRIHPISEMERKRIHKSSGGVGGKCLVHTSKLGRRRQVRREVAGRSVSGSESRMRRGPMEES